MNPLQFNHKVLGTKIELKTYIRREKVKRVNWRRTIGIICVVIGILAYYTCLYPEKPGAEIQYNWANIGIIFLLTTWIIISSFVKVKMICGMKSRWLNFLSLALFFSVAIMSAISVYYLGSQSSGVKYNLLSDILLYSFLFGWALADLVDVIF